MGITTELFGCLPDGPPVRKFILNAGGSVQAEVCEYGAALTSLTAPDRDGTPGEAVLGFDTLDDTLADGEHFGVVVGRYANRIAHGRFELDGETYALACNNPPNHLHGGEAGFGRRMWAGEAADTDDGARVVFTRVSPDGEEGYPGTLTATVTYTLTPLGVLRIEFSAITDRATVVNLASHAYYNLSGAETILDHRLKLHAHKFSETDETSIPTGNEIEVKGTPFDFLDDHVIGERINDPHPQLVIGQGYDQNFIVDGGGGTLRPVAQLHDPASGRILEISSTQPCVQFYSGNHIAGITGRDGVVLARHAGLCLETQHYPDSPNHAEFPTTRLEPGETYREVMELKLSAQ